MGGGGVKGRYSLCCGDLNLFSQAPSGDKKESAHNVNHYIFKVKMCFNVSVRLGEVYVKVTVNECKSMLCPLNVCVEGEGAYRELNCNCRRCILKWRLPPPPCLVCTYGLLQLSQNNIKDQRDLRSV